MANIFDTAQEFYQNNPQTPIVDKKRKLYTKELLFVIETAPFLTANEKSQMQMLIPLYSTRVIRNVKTSLIQQGIIFLKMNKSDAQLDHWIKEVSQPQ